MNHASKSSKNSCENLQNVNRQRTPSQRFLRIFFGTSSRLFHQILDSIPKRTRECLRGIWQRKSTTFACWFLVESTLFLAQQKLGCKVRNLNRRCIATVFFCDPSKVESVTKSERILGTFRGCLSFKETQGWK